ncbi:MAG: hypothetical protein WD377_09630 [Nitriliruptoraceae bacterium]
MDETVDIRVVVADAVPAARDSLRRIIEATWGWQVVGTATDAFEAVRMCRSEQADLLLFDASTPGMAVGDVRAVLNDAGTLVIEMIERPQAHARAAGAGLAALKSLPADALHASILEHLRAHWGSRAQRAKASS